MSEPAKPSGVRVKPDPTTAPSAIRLKPEEQPVVCERCGGANVYRMHAVWRCADCRYKTDCCGW